MSTITLSFTEEQRSQLNRRAAEKGFANVEQYAAATLLSESAFEGPEDDIEQLLIERMQEPKVSMTPDDIVNRARQRADARRQVERPVTQK